MTLGRRTVTVFLSDEGKDLLGRAALSSPDPLKLSGYVQDTDDLGIWIRVGRGDGEHVVLVRWDFVITVDFLPGETKAIGLRK